MQIKQLINEQINLLNKNNIDDSCIVAKILLCKLLNVNNQYLVINADKNIDINIENKFRKQIAEVIDGKPLQYITNNQEFMKLDFYVDENVLIPQPDTEILVEEVLKICKENYKDNVSILDLCTGSGAIAISLDTYIKTHKTVIGSDISKGALNVAKKNNKNNNTNVQFICSDMFNKMNEKAFDIIVSNPPYIRTELINTLSKDVQSEPNLALDGGNDGLIFYKKIAEESYKYIKGKGYLCLEIGYDQKEKVIQLLQNTHKYINIRAIKDLSGNDRCVIAKCNK